MKCEAVGKVGALLFVVQEYWGYSSPMLVCKDRVWLKQPVGIEPHFGNCDIDQSVSVHFVQCTLTKST